MKSIFLTLIIIGACGKHDKEESSTQPQEEDTISRYSVILEPLSSNVHGVSAIEPDGTVRIAASGLEASKSYRQFITTSNCKSSILKELDTTSSDELGLYSLSTTADFTGINLSEKSLVLKDADLNQIVACGKLGPRNFRFD